MSKKSKKTTKDTASKETEPEPINIEAIKMKGSGASFIPGLGDFEDGEVYLVPDKVSKIDAKNLVDRDVASSVKRSESDKEVAAQKDEEVKDHGGE